MRSLLCSPQPWWLGIIFVVSFFFCFNRTLEGWAVSCLYPWSLLCPRFSVFFVFRPHPRTLGVVVVVVPGVSPPQGKLFFCYQGFVPQEKLFFGPRGFVPQGKLGWLMLPRSPANCASGFRPPREAGAASMTPLSPAAEALLFVLFILRVSYHLLLLAVCVSSMCCIHVEP